MSRTTSAWGLGSIGRILFLVCEVFPTVICARDASGDRDYDESDYPFGDPINVEKPFSHYCEES